MRILFVVNGTTLTGGATKSLISLIKGLNAVNNEIMVICPDDKGLYNYLRENNIRTIPLTFIGNAFSNKGIKNKLKNFLRIPYSYIYNLYPVKKIIEEIKEFQPDIIHENTTASDIGYKLSKLLNLPYIVHIREYGDKDFNLYIPKLKKRLKDKNTYSISITKDIQKHRKQIKNPRSFQFYNGIISSENIRYNKNKKPFFLYAGRIEKAKGVKELLESYGKYNKKLKGKSFILKLAGKFNKDESYFSDCLSIIKKYQLEDKVEWLGEVNNIEDLYYETLATIIPSHFEGLGRVMPEAIANGCLCLGRSTGGTKEQMEEGMNYTGGSTAISFHDDSELTIILEKLHIQYGDSDPFEKDGEFYEIIHRGQKFVEEYFSIEKYGIKIENLYKEILCKQIEK